VSASTRETTASVDTVTSEVITSRLNMVCDEGLEAARRVSASPIVFAIGDVMTAILLPDGTPVMGSKGGGGLFFRNAIRATIERCTENPGINEGDMFVINDPFLGPRHQPDVIIYGPIHYEGELVGWVGTQCHHLDTGAMRPGGWIADATEIYQEGYRFPPLKLVERGVLRSDIFGAIMNLVRSPDKVALDYKGQIASNNVLKAKFLEVCDKYGYESVRSVLLTNLERTRVVLAERLRELPDGTFTEKVFQEQNDGRFRQLLKYNLAVTKEGDTITFDFTGTSPQQRGPTNSALVNAEFYGLTYMLRFTIGTDIEFNMGFRDVAELIAPPGTLCNPVAPAPVSSGTSLSTVVMQACLSKLLLCSEDHREGATGVWRTLASLMVVTAGLDQSGDFYVYTILDCMGHGTGAKTYGDGVDVGGDLISADQSLANVEIHEASNPILYKYRRHALDSGGPGRFRGGVGLEEAWVPHNVGHMIANVYGYGTEQPIALGIGGGQPGGLNFASIMRGGAAGPIDRAAIDEGRLPAASPNLSLGAEDVFWMSTLGGGGYGDPLDRDVDAVFQDVRDACVSVEAASTTYGVVVTGSRGSWAVDEAATEARRAEIRAARLAASVVPSDDVVDVDTSSASRLVAIGDYLEIVDTTPAVVRCTRCGHVYCSAELNHKEHAAVLTTSVHESQANLLDVPELVVRRYHCPSCAVQFWVDVDEADEPISFDVRVRVPSS